MYYPGITHCIWVPFFAEWRLQCAESPTVQRPVPPRAHLAAWRWPCRSSSSSCARRATFADMERGHKAAAVTKTAPRSCMAPDRARSRPLFDLERSATAPPPATSPMTARLGERAMALRATSLSRGLMSSLRSPGSRRPRPPLATCPRDRSHRPVAAVRRVHSCHCAHTARERRGFAASGPPRSQDR